jgi:hypothetical protein
MNRSEADRKAGADAVGRSLMKALIWRLFDVVNTLTLAQPQNIGGVSPGVRINRHGSGKGLSIGIQGKGEL